MVLTAPRTATKSQIAMRLWHAVTALIVGAALVVQIWLVIIGSTDVNAVTGTQPNPLPVRLTNTFSYFTIQSNILVLISAIRLLIDPTLRGFWWRVVRLDGLLGIVITGVVYVTVLRPLASPTGIYAAVNAGLHYLPPPLVLFGWLIFGPRPRIAGRVLAGALIWPLAWIVYTLVRGAFTSWYPYPFMDVGALGYPVALRNIAVVIVIAVLLAVIMKLIDRLPAIAGSDRSAQPAGQPRR